MIATKIQYSNAAVGQDASILQEIHSNAKNIAICQRSIQPLQEQLALAVKQPIAFRGGGTVKELSISLRGYFETMQQLNEALPQDVLHFLELFQELTKVSSFRLSFVKINSTMCPRFHADNNYLRMLCTYYGPGTLWLPDEVVDRKAYRTGKSNENILLDEGLVQQVDTGDVVILKGSLYPESNPILHRSPSLQENEEKRILLSIDTNQPIDFPG